jgi:thiol:disulfide interchange protein
MSIKPIWLAIAAAAVTLGVILYRQHGPAPEQAPLWTPAPQADTTPVQPIPPPQQIQPEAKPQTIEEAFKLAREQNKKVVLMFTTPGCLPCEIMKRDVLPNAEVKKALDKVVFFVVDAAKDPNTCLQFRVQQFPTMILATGTMQAQKIYIGGMSAPQIIQWLDDVPAPQPRKGILGRR